MECAIRCSWSIQALNVHHPSSFSSLSVAGIHHVSAVLQHSAGELARRAGLGEAEVAGLVVEASRMVVQHSKPTTALCLYQAEAEKLNRGELLMHLTQVIYYLCTHVYAHTHTHTNTHTLRPLIISISSY